jgi:Ca-activated chloride channel family protein
MHFGNPWFLVLLPVMIVLVTVARQKERRPSFHFPSGEMIQGLHATSKIKLSRSMFILRIAALALIVIALCRPQQMIEESIIETEGIDIILAIDTSTSMLAEDFELHGKRTNRLEAVKEVVKVFIDNRKSDRIGIIAFGGRAYTVSPLTLDHGWLIQNLERIKIGMNEDGTAIGSGLSSSLSRLKDTETKSRIVILLTDGRNNAGRITPLVAAEAAGALGIKVYTVGAGTKGYAPYPDKGVFGNRVYRRVKIEIDEDTLQKIAERTDARYFRATDINSLKNIYEEIDRLETTPIKEKGYIEYRELFHLVLFPGLLLIILETILNKTILRRIP